MGQSKESDSRILAELRNLNPEGEDHYSIVDVSLIKSVDQVSLDLRQKEQANNLLFLSKGTLITGRGLYRISLPSILMKEQWLMMRVDADDGLNYLLAVAYYAGIRLVLNLLPFLQHATPPPPRFQRLHRHQGKPRPYGTTSKAAASRCSRRGARQVQISPRKCLQSYNCGIVVVGLPDSRRAVVDERARGVILYLATSES